MFSSTQFNFIYIIIYIGLNYNNSCLKALYKDYYIIPYNNP